MKTLNKYENDKAVSESVDESIRRNILVSSLKSRPEFDAKGNGELISKTVLGSPYSKTRETAAALTSHSLFVKIVTESWNKTTKGAHT